MENAVGTGAAFDPPVPTDGTRRGLSRRQIMKAGVWASPVIVLATALPAAATSTVPAQSTPHPPSEFSFFVRSKLGGTTREYVQAAGPTAVFGPVFLQSWGFHEDSGRPGETAIWELFADGPGGQHFPLAGPTAVTLNIGPGADWVWPVPATATFGEIAMTPGIYTVTLQVTGADGVLHRDQKSITITGNLNG